MYMYSTRICDLYMKDHETFEQLGELTNSSIDVHSQAERVTEDERV